MNTVEKAYGMAFKTALWFAVPFKKIFIKTQCEVHVFLNNHAVQILKNDGYTEAYEFFDAYKDSLNEGTVWADQDFRSREHFYNPYSQKGLFGCKSSKQRFQQYYCHALVYWDCSDYSRAMFYLGAALHLIQDSTIPQHGSINLLKSHRSYEQWIIKVYNDFEHYTVKNGGTYLDSPYKYIPYNAKHAIQICNRYSLIKNYEEKYERIANNTFHMAQRTTAGCLMNFYTKIHDMDFYETVLKCKREGSKCE